MMEKEFDNRDLDRLLYEWSDNLLTPEEDQKVSDKMNDFLEYDSDIEEVLTNHIHELAVDERRRKNHRIKAAVFSSAASLALLITAAGLLMRENTSHIDTIKSDNPVMAYQAATLKPVISETKQATEILPTNENVRKVEPEKVMKKRMTSVKKTVEKPSSQEETEYLAETTMSEEEIAKTLSEIDISFSNLFGNTFDDMSMAESEMIPATPFYENEIFNTYVEACSVESLRTNITNTLYEMKKININLNFGNNY